MTNHPEEPPFKKLGAWYLILKVFVLTFAAFLALRLLGLI